MDPPNPPTPQTPPGRFWGDNRGASPPFHDVTRKRSENEGESGQRDNEQSEGRNESVTLHTATVRRIYSIFAIFRFLGADRVFGPMFHRYTRF